MDLSRRKFLTRAATFIAAPAIIRVADLMPIKAYAMVADDPNIGYTLLKPEDEVLDFNVGGGFRARWDNSIGRWIYTHFDKRGLPLNNWYESDEDPVRRANRLGLPRFDLRDVNSYGNRNGTTFVAKADDALF